MLHASNARAAWPEPWSDDDPAEPPGRYLLGDVGFRGAAEYRAQGLLINPLSLNTEVDRKAAYIEQRLRLDGTVDYKDKIRMTASIDALDGVLWGDNGDLGRAPEPDSGSNVNARNVNVAKPCIQYRADRAGNPFEARSYGLGLCSADPIFVRRMFGDVITPIGLFRVGRQAFTEGTGVAVTDGEGRRNRFGITNRGNTADRVLFVTKPLEALKPKGQQSASEREGLFLILAYDNLVTDNPQVLSGNLHGWITAVRLLAPKYRFGSDLELRAFHAYRWDIKNDTGVSALGLRATSRFGDVYAGFDMSAITGSTREISEAFKVINNDPAVSQPIRQIGARAVVRYDRPKWTAYLEGDYASGDSDPRSRTPLTQFRFAEDANVGLLLFKHILAYQTGRASAAAVELLKSLKAPTIPVESIATRGAFTNAAAIFPQVDYRPLRTLLLRAGVLFAWAPAKVNDPVASQTHRIGTRAADELVNFVGGKPGTYYGTEIDVRFQWRYEDHFALDLEAALLFPGSALEDQDGHAVRSGMAQARTTFFF